MFPEWETGFSILARVSTPTVPRSHKSICHWPGLVQAKCHAHIRALAGVFAQKLFVSPFRQGHGLYMFCVHIPNRFAPAYIYIYQAGAIGQCAFSVAILLVHSWQEEDTGQCTFSAAFCFFFSVKEHLHSAECPSSWCFLHGKRASRSWPGFLHPHSHARITQLSARVPGVSRMRNEVLNLCPNQYFHKLAQKCLPSVEVANSSDSLASAYIWVRQQ